MGVGHEDGQGLPERIAAGMAKLSLVLRQEAWRVAGERGLTPLQAQILTEVAAAGRGAAAAGLGLTALAERLAVTAGTASAAVSTLVAKGLVEKRRGLADGRAVALSLTPSGRRAAVPAGRWPVSVLAAADGLDESEQVGLVRGLVGILRGLHVIGQVPTAAMCVQCRYFRPHVHGGGSKAHHCASFDEVIGDVDLRFDCAVQEPVPLTVEPRLWAAYQQGRRLDAEELGLVAGGEEAGAAHGAGDVLDDDSIVGGDAMVPATGLARERDDAAFSGGSEETRVARYRHRRPDV